MVFSNIVNVSTILGKTAYMALSNTDNTTLVSNAIQVEKFLKSTLSL